MKRILLAVLAIGTVAFSAPRVSVAQSYNGKVYRAQGGDEMVVDASGSITVKSGGNIAVESGGGYSVPSGATVGGTGTGTFGTLSVTGNSTLGDATADRVTMNASTMVVANVANAVSFSTHATLGTAIMSLDGANIRVGIAKQSPTVPLDVTGAIAGSSTITAGTNLITTAGYLQLYSRSRAELTAITPSAVGQEYYDNTGKLVVISTGTGAGNFAKADGTAWE